MLGERRSPIDLSAAIKGIERLVTPTRREEIVAFLRRQPLDIVDGGEVAWDKSNIYFHSIQDVEFAAAIPDLQKLFPDDWQDYVLTSQACFVKDLGRYIVGFPPGEESMRGVFEMIYSVGTSAFWHEDMTLVRDLYSLYKELDETVIQPWVNKG